MPSCSSPLSPICLFVYNRPWHTKHTLDHLASAKLANSSLLYIFCDGPKIDTTAEELDKIKSVRELALAENRFRQVKVVMADENAGLGRSIVGGISSVLGEHDTVIVLEDDILVHPDFLVFMNYNLHNYRSNKEVMHISAFQRNSWLQFLLPCIFFTRFMDCWGWATWADRWNLLITDISVFDKYLALEKNRVKFDFGTLEHSHQFDLNKNAFKTWAIFWYGSIVMLNGLCLKPKFSYTKNIGNDGSGVHNVVNTTELASNFVGSFRKYDIKPRESRIGEWYIRDAYSKRSKKRFNRVKDVIFKLLTLIRSKVLGKKQWQIQE
jgi:hypothetical protein